MASRHYIRSPETVKTQARDGVVLHRGKIAAILRIAGIADHQD